MQEKIRNYSEALAFVHGRRKFAKAPTLKRMRRLAELLGEPEKKLSFVHITGTNGKGSVTAFLRDLLMAEGYQVGTFTSPFIVKFNERISVNGQMISDDEITELVVELVPLIAQVDREFADFGGGPTEFEVVTAMMLLYFSRHTPDFVLVEVGIGGLNDSTNIITPLLSVITSVGLDHMQLLGNTIEEIAAHKAGIIKDKIPVVCGHLPDGALNVIRQKSQENGADLYLLGQEFFTKPKLSRNFWGEVFDYRFKTKTIKDVKVSLVGAYQRDNAAVALTSFAVLMQKIKRTVNLGQTAKVLEKTVWPARFEKINSEPLIVIDGAHNPAAIQQLAQTLREKFSQAHVYLILAILQDKQYEQMIQIMQKLPNVTLILTSFNAPRDSFPLDELSAKYPELQVIDKWNEALGAALSEMSAEDLLLISGSLYFAAEVRQYFQ
ncbi:folylpolyglutamate synthase [Ligilactobacillus salitolerans]|uniref:tetrahydrofolate synthase n=1 Tax=Ligilactobacillus salitolerans TaxID=1808352 RepID=A0A401IR31_9LACO|nr:folylpolyglutamate synthase/dihydrofolate synthase family protein [Ligilactobacillus salitolerans]GBG93965.1 folylpolyglutamate synthase [Ligilactobacillus salitolerans]